MVECIKLLCKYLKWVMTTWKPIHIIVPLRRTLRSPSQRNINYFGRCQVGLKTSGLVIIWMRSTVSCSESTLSSPLWEKIWGVLVEKLNDRVSGLGDTDIEEERGEVVQQKQKIFLDNRLGSLNITKKDQSSLEKWLIPDLK